MAQFLPITIEWDGGVADTSNGGYNGAVYAWEHTVGVYPNEYDIWNYAQIIGTSFVIIDKMCLAKKTGYKFLGWEAVKAPAMNRVLMYDDNGDFTEEYYDITNSRGSPLYATYRRFVFNVTLNRNGGSGGTATAYYNKDVVAYASDAGGSSIISAVTIPTRNQYRFLGYYSATSGGTQYIDANGNFTSAAYSVSITADVTWYARWSRVSYPLTVNKGSGTGGPNTVYSKATSGGIYAEWQCTTRLTTITPPTLACYAFNGYFSAASGGTKYTDANGAILNALSTTVFTAAATIYAQFTRATFKVTFSKDGGTGGTNTAYTKVTTGGIYADDLAKTEITSIVPPTKAGFAFVGYFSESTGGTAYTDNAGNILPAFRSLVATADVTVYARWRQIYTATLDKHGGSGGSVGLYYDTSTGSFYDDPACIDAVTSIIPPRRSCHTFNGYFTAETGGTKRINADGTFVSGFASLTDNVTLHAQWTRTGYAVNLDAAGGTAEPSAFVFKIGGGFFADDTYTDPVVAVRVVRAGYTFGGCFDGTTKIINADGSFAVASVSADVTIVAKWTAQSFTLYFDYQGGAGGTDSKTVTMGAAIGTLPTTSFEGFTFDGWYVDGVKITATTAWRWADNMTAMAKWRKIRTSSFGDTVDYFYLESPLLQIVNSSSGDNKQRIYVSHIGKNEPNVGGVGGVWRNPEVVYQVVGDVNLNVVLGKAFAGTDGVSGYMITSVRVDTAIGKFPKITVSAVANEGADAINKFTVACLVLARARAQNLMNAIGGGGALQSCKLSAQCDPVVIAENQMPCASDIVNGRVNVTATTYAPNRENVPVAGGGFVFVGIPKETNGVDYQSWQINAIKDL